MGKVIKRFRSIGIDSHGIEYDDVHGAVTEEKNRQLNEWVLAHLVAGSFEPATVTSVVRLIVNMEVGQLDRILEVEIEEQRGKL